ncbi:MAG: TlpA family protein disulfide reductase [Myxococcota bacterium]|nr:TlpA family protein disulfide reductase [Myxococcota bacterium]
MRALPILLVAILGCRGSKATPAPTEKVDERSAVAALIGTTPPEWQVERWIGSPPRTLASLRGSVVMVRWWTAGCPFCSTSAPALRHFDRTYGPRGLQVIGVYHHKEATPFDPAVYEETARKYGFTFPVAFDPEWQTFESWSHDREGKPISTGWTSVTFLLDRRGVIRHVHPGGQYVEGDPAYGEMQAAIERLLAES